MFRFRQHERTDCCALTCCGILQSDRDRFLLTGVTPPRGTKRLTVHIILPLVLFGAAGVGALHIQDVRANQFFCTTLMLVLLGYLMTSCAKGRAKRIGIRKDLLFTKYQVWQQQQQQHNREEEEEDRNLSFVLEQERPDLLNDDDDDAWKFARRKPNFGSCKSQHAAWL